MGQSQGTDISKQQFGDLFGSPNHQILIDRLNRILLTKCSQKQFFESHFASDIRHLIQERPDDSRVIILYLYKTIKQLRDEELINESLTRMINILRLITQFMPVLFENANKEFAMDLLWKQKLFESNTEDQSTDCPLIISIIKILLQILFKKGVSVQGVRASQILTKHDENLKSFTNMFQQANQYPLNLDLLWKGFVTVCPYPNDQTKFYEFRTVALQSLQACLSSSLFLPPYILDVQKNTDPNRQEKIISPNPALLAIYSLPLYPELVTSLISLVFYPEERNLFFLNKLVNKSTQEYELHKTSTKVLLTLLCGQIGVKHNPELFQNIHFLDLCITTEYFRQTNSQFPLLPQLPKSFLGSFLNQISSRLWNAFEQDDRVVGPFETQFGVHQEFLLILTYYLLQVEPQELANIKPPLMPTYLLSSLSTCSIVSSLALYGISLLSSLPFMLNQMNQNMNIRLKDKGFPVIQGQWSDLMIQSWSEKILIQKENINVHQIVSIIRNISPCIKQLQHQSANRICQMLGFFSNYDFLLPHPENATTLFKLISVVYNIFQQNLENNEYLLFELIKREAILQKLDQMIITPAKILFYCQKQNYIEVDLNVDKPVLQNSMGQNADMMEKSENQLRHSNSTELLSPDIEIMLQKQEQSQKNNHDEQIPVFNPKPLTNFEIQSQRLIKQWTDYDFSKAKNNSPLRKLIKFITTMRTIFAEKNTNQIQIEHIRDVQDDYHFKLIKERNLTCMLDLNEKLTIEKFDSSIGNPLVNRLSWQTLVEKSGLVPPYYERSECVYLDYQWI